LADESTDRRSIRDRVRELLRAPDFDESMKELMGLPRRPVMSALSINFLNEDERIRWRAITAFGVAAADLADKDMEAGRVILQRLMWNLNEESGNYAPGAAEAMAEIMAANRGLADEFAHVLVSFITPGGLYLDDEQLLKGAIWGIGRLAQKRPELLKDALAPLATFLGSRDPQLRGLAAWATIRIGGKDAAAAWEELRKDHAEIKLYVDRGLRVLKIKDVIERETENTREDKMKEFESVDHILDFAIEREQEAAEFYAGLAEQAKRPGMKALFEQFSKEEQGHKAKLINIKDGKLMVPAEKRVADLKIGDYLVDVEPGPDLDYQGALILAMKKEKAAFKLYTDLAEQAPDENLKELFGALAQEEAKHKLRFEVEYDDMMNQEN
jgi:rubrerythrin